MGGTDVEVRDAGVSGLSAAYFCVRIDACIRVFERQSIGTGAIGGLVGSLSPRPTNNCNAKKQFHFNGLVVAEDWWIEVTKLSGIDLGFRRIGTCNLCQASVHAGWRNWKGKAHWRLERADSVQWIREPLLLNLFGNPSRPQSSFCRWIRSGTTLSTTSISTTAGRLLFIASTRAASRLLLLSMRMPVQPKARAMAA